MSNLADWALGPDLLVAESRRLLDLLRAQGTSRAEVYRKRSFSMRQVRRPDAGPSRVSAVEEGLALRGAWATGRCGFRATSDVRPENVSTICDRVARDAAVGPPLDIPGRRDATTTGSPTPDAGLFDELDALAEELGGTLSVKGRSAVRCSSLQVHAGWVEVALVTSAGFEGYYARPVSYAAVEAVARHEGDARSALLLRAASRPAAIDPEELAERVARRAATALGGRPAPTGSFPAVVDADAAADLLQEVALAWVGRGRLTVGETVASSGITVVDDGTLESGPLEAPFDGEGTPTRRTVVVDAGRLAARLHDRASARAAGARRTGNGVRHSFRDPPAAAPSHLAIAPGSTGPEDLVAGLDRGLYVTHLRAVGARGGPGLAALVEGVWVESGRAAWPVTETLIAMPRAELLERVQAVGNDLRYHPAGGAVGSPSLLVEPVTVLS